MNHERKTNINDERQAVLINHQRESKETKPYGTKARHLTQCNIFFLDLVILHQLENPSAGGCNWKTPSTLI